MFHNPTGPEFMADAYRAMIERGSRPQAESPAASIDEERRRRSLRYCHYPAPEKPHIAAPETNAYVPELSARLETDPNLTDGARRCARQIAAYTYLHHREDRKARITVSYLARTLRKCRRTVQRYLRQLERAGYLRIGVVSSGRTRMSVGLVIELLTPLLPRHRRAGWPGKSGATQKSHRKRILDSQCEGKLITPRESWALRCMDGVFRSLIETLPPVSRVTP